MSTPAGFTLLIAAKIQDAGGNLITGTLEVIPTDGSNLPITATAGGGGAISIRAAIFAITVGALGAAAWVPDISETRPANISYRFTFKDAVGNVIYVLKGVQPTGASLNLDTYLPNVASQAIIQYGPAGVSAYQQWLAAGNTGSVAQFLASLTGLGFLTLPPNVDNALFAILDRIGNVWDLYSSTYGWKYFRALSATLAGDLHAVNGFLSGDLHLAGTLFSSQFLQLPPNVYGATFGIFNADGSFQVLLTPTGFIFPGTPPAGYTLPIPSSTASLIEITSSALAAAAPLKAPYPAYYDYLDGSSRKQLAKLINQTETILTSGSSNNWQPHLDTDGTLLFITDRTGHRRLWRMNIDGSSPYYAELAPFAGQYGIVHLPITGQSLAFGADTYNPVPPSTSQPYSNLMFSATGEVSGVNVLVNGASGVALVALTATNTGSPTYSTYETLANGLADSASQRTAAILYDNPSGPTVHTMLVSNSGIPGYIYRQLCGPTDWNSSNPYWTSGSAGSASFRELMAQVTAAKSLAAAASKTYFVPCVVVIHGEFDANDSSYYVNMQTWQNDIQTGIQAITGQSGTIPFLLMQTATGVTSPTAAAPFDNGGHASGGPSSGPTSSMAQIALAVTFPTKFILAGSEYHLPHNDGLPHTVGGSSVTELTIHPTAIGQRMMGGILSKAYERAFLQGKTWYPLMPIDINITGKKIVIDYFVPVQPLVLDTSWCAQLSDGNYGFVYSDPDGAVIATGGVAVTGPAQITLTLTQNAAASGRAVSYAAADPGAAYGPVNGPNRGCLRDSDAVANKYDATDGVPSHNYSLRWAFTL